MYGARNILRWFRSTNTQLVFIVNEKGLFSHFNLLKSALAHSSSAITLIYLMENPQTALFSSELKELEKRFMQRLVVYYHTLQEPSVLHFDNFFQKQLEVVINCKITKRMDFWVIGNRDMLETIPCILHMLGINKKSIQIRIP